MSGALSAAATLVWLLAPPSNALSSSIDSKGQAAVTVATGLGVLARAVMAGVALGGAAAVEGSFQPAAWLAVEHAAVRVTMQIAELIERIRGTWEHVTPLVSTYKRIRRGAMGPVATPGRRAYLNR